MQKGPEADERTEQDKDGKTFKATTLDFTQNRAYHHIHMTTYRFYLVSC